MKCRKENIKWVNHPGPEEVEVNRVTGLLSAGNSAIWASLDRDVVSYEYRICVHVGTSNIMYLDNDLVMQTNSRLLCT